MKDIVVNLTVLHVTALNYSLLRFTTCRISLFTFRYGQMGNISRPQGSDPRTVQPAAGRCND